MKELLLCFLERDIICSGVRIRKGDEGYVGYTLSLMHPGIVVVACVDMVRRKGR